MEFVEGSKGLYGPIKVLFDTPIYDRALELCWNMTSYKTQIALVRELLRLQQKKQIPSQVTAEDMINLILEENKRTLRERLWEFELKDFEEEDTKPLLKLVWAVNMSNKMRDIEFEARMLLNSKEPLTPNFQHPRVLSMAKDYAKTLRKKQKKAPSSELLSPNEVVFEVVPRVLQGFWVLPPCSLLNMPSQKLSTLSVGVTKAVLDQVSNVLSTVKHQATFSCSIRDDMVLSILTRIRQTRPNYILVEQIKSFAPVLLSDIVDVVVGQICGMFQPQIPRVPAHLRLTVKPSATIPVQDAFNLVVTKKPTTPTPRTNSAVVSPLTASPTASAEPPSITEVHAREVVNEKCSLEKDPEPITESDYAVVPASPPPAAKLDENGTPSLVKDPEPTRQPHSAAFPASATPPVEPPSITDVESREDEDDKPCFENDAEPIREPDSVVVPASRPPAAKVDENRKPSLLKDPEPTREPDSVVVPAPTAPPTESCIDPEPTREPLSAAVPSPTSPAEPPSMIKVQAMEDEDDKPCFVDDSEATRKPDYAVVPAFKTPPADPPSGKSDETCLEKDPEPNSKAGSAAVPAALTTLAEQPDHHTREPLSAVASPSPTSPDEPPSFVKVQTREDGNDKPCLEKDLESTRDPVPSTLISTAEPPFIATLAPLPPPAEPLVITAITTSLAKTEQPTSSPALGTSITEPPCITYVQDRGDTNEKLILDKGPKSTRETDSVVVSASMVPVTPRLPTVRIVIEPELEEKRVLGFFRWLFHPLCSCFV